MLLGKYFFSSLMPIILQSPILANGWDSLGWQEQEAKTPAQSEQWGNSLAGPHVSGMGDDLMLYGEPGCFDRKVKSAPPNKPHILGTSWHLGAVEPLDRGVAGKPLKVRA